VKLTLPPIPAWDSLHPLVVHFPIGLLLVAPIFVALGLLLYQRTRAYCISALVLMALGTIGAWVSVASGLAAMLLAATTGDADVVLQDHERLALLTRTVFTGLVVGYAIILVLPKLLKRDMKQSLVIVVHGCYLLAYAFGMLLIVNVGHLGGRLVHEFDVRALM